MKFPAAIALLVLALSGCSGSAVTETPNPVAMTEDAVGHYCQMNVIDHSGPKAQIHLAGLPAPLWFAQVRDAVAFLREPEKVADVIVVYVSDMARAESWEVRGDENWIAADKATFVVGSDAKGGMGAPEVVPFGTEDAAKAFMAKHGGRLMRLDDIPSEAVLGGVEIQHEESSPTVQHQTKD